MAGPADLIITGAKVITVDPSFSIAEAVAVRDDKIIAVGGAADVAALAADHTRIIDAGGRTVIPGLIDAHTHVFNLGATLEQIDLVGVATEEEAVARVVARAGDVAPGTWLIGYGWDEGAWADDYPDKTLLTARLPNHPVLMRGLHSFAVWGNQAALDAAGITAQTVVPDGGRLPLDDEETRKRFSEMFGAQGIDAERVELLSWVASTSGHLEAYNKIDIGLDPFPFAGATTTFQALWMGVPVISLMGGRFSSRAGGSISTHTGLGDLAVESDNAFVEHAVALAADLPRLADLRATLRQRLEDSPLCDGPAYARNVEDALRAMWEERAGGGKDKAS